MRLRRASLLVVPILVFVLGGAPLRAASTPVINVRTYGLELCSQAMCGAAIFSGFIFGRVGLNPYALGTFIVAVNHDPVLPDDPGEVINLTGGAFEFRVGLRKITGVIQPGGTLTYNGGDTFTIDATLVFLSGASGTANYVGILDHNVFPPTVVGAVTQ